MNNAVIRGICAVQDIGRISIPPLGTQERSSPKDFLEEKSKLTLHRESERGLKFLTGKRNKINLDMLIHG